MGESAPVVTLGGRAFAELVAAAPGFDGFGLVDIGCSGGLDPMFAAFGDRLRAFGFDPSIDECARLAAAETRPLVRYVSGFVAGAAPAPTGGNPWPRLAAALSVQRLGAAAGSSLAARFRLNDWQATRLADPAAPIDLPAFLAAAGVATVDMVKIDVDGADFGILHHLLPTLPRWGVLAVSLEVNFFGTGAADEHSFHNSDRAMRAAGYDLFALSVRRYAHAALPAPYRHGVPGPGSFGRPLQGDALYLRDPGRDPRRDPGRDPRRDPGRDPRRDSRRDPGRDPAAGQDIAPARQLKLAAVAALAGVPDFAADILLRERTAIGGLIDVARALDLLAAQAQPDADDRLGYDAYMAAFDRATGPFARDRGGADTAEELRARLAAIEASTSWRLTAPLRRLAGFLRRT